MNKKCRTPLSIAAGAGAHAKVRRLLAESADPNNVGGGQLAPLDYARMARCERAAMLLGSYGGAR